tara:strand:- start:50 stop:634 length:585 start_codon:yes stop_codon:yes gene_type:complete
MGFIGVQPTSVPLTSSDITDGIISTAKIADDAVDNTKLDLTANYAFTGTISGTSTSTVFQLESDAQQDINNNVETIITFNSATIDTASITSTTNNNVVITAATAGTYLIHCNSRINQRPGRHELYFLVNNSIKLLGAKGSNDAGSGANPVIELTGILTFSNGDVLNMKHWQSSGSTLSTIASYNSPSLIGVRLF